MLCLRTTYLNVTLLFQKITENNSMTILQLKQNRHSLSLPLIISYFNVCPLYRQPCDYYSISSLTCSFKGWTKNLKCQLIRLSQKIKEGKIISVAIHY